MIFLTSSVASVATHLYKHFLADKGFKTVLFIDTAAEPEIGNGEDDEWLQNDLQSLRDQGYRVDRYTITGQTRDEIEKKIDAYDVIYMSGGNTAYLLDQLQKTNSLTLIKEKVGHGKPYIGTSAGSIIAGPRITGYLKEREPVLDDYAGFGFVNFVVAPHWGSDMFRDEYIGGRIETAYRLDQPPYVLLNDKQYIHVTDEGLIEIVETKLQG